MTTATSIIAALERAANAASQQHKEALAAHLWNCINDLNGVEDVLQQVDDAESDLVWALQHGMEEEHTAACQHRVQLTAKLPAWLCTALEFEWLSPRAVLDAAMRDMLRQQAVF